MTQTTWNLKPLFKSDTDPEIPTWRKIVTDQTTRFVKKWSNNTKYLTDSQTLRLALDDYNTWLEKYGHNDREVSYFHLRESQNETDPKIKAKFGQAIAFAQDIANQMLFFTLSLSKIPTKQQQIFLKDPLLKPYHHLLSSLFTEGKYTLTEPEEKILNLKSQTSNSNWQRMTSSMLANETVTTLSAEGKKIQANLSQLMQLVNHPKQQVRDTAAHQINLLMAKYADVAENELNSLLQDHQTNDRLRGFTRPDQSRLLGDDVSDKTIDAMLQAVSANNKLAHTYYQLKSKLLGKHKLAYHERNVDLGNVKTTYSYTDSYKLIFDTFHSLDPEFSLITESFIKEGRVDVYPENGKSGGAFCTHNGKTIPVYILLNHTNTLHDVMTFAHELGHGINHTLINRTQPAVYCSSSLATAEVASTFMEDFVLATIARSAPQKEQLALRMMKLNDDISTIFRQVACYRFEQELHQQFRNLGYLDKKTIGQIFQKHMSAYMGKYVEQSAGCEYWWVYWSHIRNYFYVYSYASGLLISKALQRRVRENPNFITAVKDFLATGTSQSPEATFKRLGIDITNPKFWEEGIAEIAEELKHVQKLIATKNPL